MYLSSTELGRITSHYYIACETMATFCKSFSLFQEANEEYEKYLKRRNEYKRDIDIWKIVSSAKEFEQIKLRPEEFDEIKKVVMH